MQVQDCFGMFRNTGVYHYLNQSPSGSSVRCRRKCSPVIANPHWSLKSASSMFVLYMPTQSCTVLVIPTTSIPFPVPRIISTNFTLPSCYMRPNDIIKTHGDVSPSLNEPMSRHRKINARPKCWFMISQSVESRHLNAILHIPPTN
jgi:hypothetical protein